MAPPSRRVAPFLIWMMMLAPTVTSFLRLSSLSVGPRATATATTTAAHGAAGRRQSRRRGCGLFGSSSSSSVPPSMVEQDERAAAAAPTAIQGDVGAEEGGAPAAAGKAALGFMRNALHRVRDVNRLPPTAMKVLNFVVDDVVLGKVTDHNAEILLQFGTDVFERRHAHVGEEDADADDQGDADDVCLTLAAHAGSTFEERTEAVARVTEQLRREGIVRGWRDELYPVTANFYQAPVLAMERAAVPLLGALEYGVHINGLVKDGTDDTVRMWMARRSRHKSKYPGMLDHLVAGGQPLGISVWDNVLKECHEEAGIPSDVARAGLRPVSAISYETYVKSSQSISRAVLFNYDLYLPSSFRPVPVDGEVDEFFLWTIDEVLESLDPAYPDPIKPNCYSVIVDFLVRHGHLSPDTPGYLDVIRELRSGECR